MLRTLMLTLAVLSGLAAVGCAPSLAAPPHLVAAWPAAGARLPVDQQTFDLTFNRRLATDPSWFVVWREEDGAAMATDATIDPHNPRQAHVRLLEPAPGAYRLHWHAVAARSAASADGEQDFALQDESNVPPLLELSRTVAEVGDTLEIVGRGFGPNSPVKLMMADDQIELATVEADRHGDFRAETSVPPNAPFGVQPVSAEDTRGGVARAALQVHWGGWPPLVSFTVGRPGPRAGQVTFSVTVRNRSDYVLEGVRVVLSDPEGSTFVSAVPPPRRQTAAAEWQIPTMDRGASGPFRATYRAAGAVVAHTWVEFRHRHTLGCTEDDCMPAFISESVSQSAEIDPVAAGDSPRRQD